MVYNQLTIERTEADNKKRYTKDDYQRLEQFYESKVHQIHIVGEYAKKMISDYQEALQFVDDYFQLNYTSFLRKYFPGSKADDLRLRVTPAKFKQLFGELSPRQLKIINDNESKYIVVAAGPGSGKTKVLVHKLASLLLMEDVKHEQLLMLTFSRAAATEFKQRLSNLHEVRFFTNQLQLTADTFVIADEIWEEAKSAFKRQFHRSNNFEMVSNLIHDFETSNPKQKYKSDLEVFIQESHPEDFILAGVESIIVSTIHKAKGREFDNVYLMLDNINISKDEVVRQLYVAMTRAKENLIIHINSDYLNQISADDLIIKHDSTQYPTPDKLIMQLSLRDVWLDFFIRRQHIISQLISGDSLDLMEDGCTTQGKPILKFSQQFLKQIESLTNNNYQVQTAKVNHLVYWKKEDSEEEVLVVLVEVGFGRG